MDHEKQTTLFDGALNVLQNRVALMGGLAVDDVKWIEDLSEERTVLSAALTQAALETIWTSTISRFDEEHHTSSFMGHFTSCLSWFNLMDRWGGAEERATPEPEIFWAQQPRHIEAIRGGDFGLARRIGDRIVNIKLFQAKKAPFYEATSFSHYRDVKDREFADAELIKYERGLASTEVTSATKLHQIHRLLRWEDVGNAALRDIYGLDRPEPIWCYYMYWPRPYARNNVITFRLPTVAVARNVFRQMMQAVNLTDPSQIPMVVAPKTQNFLAMAMSDDTGICVDKEDARMLLGAMARVNLPDFLAIDESGDESGSFWSDIFDQKAVITRRSRPVTANPGPMPTDDLKLGLR